ncbi:hypothetical protein ABZ737_33990, partial [Streptomyces sp. NPDC013087]|uniref:hypothetical protein n=1 Tax=Streptomyces sp. NPDC013087 TaxID=3156694 RepID=UPI0033C3F141
MNRPVPVRYRFALQLGGQQAGIGIERIEYDRLTAFCSIYVPISNNWLQSLLDVLDAEKEEI